MPALQVDRPRSLRWVVTAIVVVGPLAALYGRTLSGSQSTSPPGSDRFPNATVIRAPSRQIPAYGPYDLSARDLIGEAARPQTPQEPEQDIAVLECPGCTAKGSVDVSLAEALRRKRTPDLTSGPRTAGALGSNIDPKIAVSSTYIVATLWGQIAFYDKSGALLGCKTATCLRLGGLKNPITTGDFFDKVNQQIDQALNLPPGVNFVIDYNNDARVVFDEYRKRFWVAAQAIDSKYATDFKTDPASRLSRRTKFVVGVSKSEDPRDGFRLYWWNETIDDGICNAPGADEFCPGSFFKPGDAGDYPSLGISKDWFVQTNQVGWRDPNDPDPDVDDYRYDHVVMALGDGFANGCSTPCTLWELPPLTAPDDVTVFRGTQLQPVVNHGPTVNFPWLVANWGNDTLIWFALVGADASTFPSIFRQDTKVTPFGRDQTNGTSLPSAPQTQDRGGTYPTRLEFSRGDVMNAVYREDELFVTWQDCVMWDTKLFNGCASSVRLQVIDPFGGATLRERSFGLRNVYDDSPDDVVWYGWPEIEVNKDLDIVAAYMRTSPLLFQEARYSVFFHAETDIRPSNVLKKGEGPLTFGRADTGGAAVDPFDDTGVWIAHLYSSRPSGTGQAANVMAFGKVLGVPYPDLYVSRVLFDLTVQPGGRLSVALRIRNQGDGAAHSSDAVVVLGPDTRLGGAVPIGRIRVPSLHSGEEVTLELTATVPTTVQPGTYDVRAIIESKDQEYSRENNLSDIDPQDPKLTVCVRCPA